MSGPTVVWSDVGVLQVTAKDPGGVTSIKVKVGDYVEKGQIIAKLDQSRVSDQLDSTKEKLYVLNRYIADIESLQNNDQRTRENLKKLLMGYTKALKS